MKRGKEAIVCIRSIAAAWAVCGTVALCGWAAAGELPRVQPQRVGLDPQTLAKLRPALVRLVDDKKIAGAVVAIARRGQVACVEVVGRQDIDADKPMREDTIFRIYSMSKPLTCIAALILVDEGKLSLDAPVGDVVPELAKLRVYEGPGDDGPRTRPPKRPLTVRDLMRHTSGFGYGIGLGPVDALTRNAKPMDRNSTLAEMVDRLSRVPLAFDPGARFQYGLSSDVLGYVVQRASAVPLDEFFQKRLFDPLDMRDTGFFVPPEKLPRLAVGYSPRLLGGLRAIDVPQSSPYRNRPRLFSGGGGLVSTARDYLRFSQMLLGGGALEGRRLLKATTVLEMTSNQLPPGVGPVSIMGLSLPGVQFGLGVAVVDHPPKLFTSLRSGDYFWAGIATTHFWVSPKDELIIVALTQKIPFAMDLNNTVPPIVYAALDAPGRK